MQQRRTIPFFNYPALFAAQEPELMAVLRDVCGRGAYILQRDCREFEENVAKFTGAKHVLGVANGTDAIWLGLRAVGIGPGDEVIVPSHTYIASVASIHFVGATPVLADCGPDHMLDPQSVHKLVTKRTRAIMPVQLNGRTCDMDALQAIADEHDLMIVEDAAQGLGSKFKGRMAGTFGKFGTISLYPAKLLGCFGDGGLVMTNDDEVARRVGLLRDHGRNEEGKVVAWGFNSRLDNLQAAILNFKMKSFPQALERRRAIAARYQARLGSLAEMTLPPAPDADPRHYDVYQNYEVEADRRDELRAYLEEQGVRTIIQWGGTPVHQFAELGFKDVNLPATDRLFKRCFLLPMHTALSDEDVDYICDAIRAFYGK
ncbi:MAG: DegT/DnrJ/EryC1/StrS family aminotransferase [Burkholderiales bacterium]|nr:DegT/DnrJ/EryC1/StrS family aminotransferase [Burkholderiales bacterium]